MASSCAARPALLYCSRGAGGRTGLPYVGLAGLYRCLGDAARAEQRLAEARALLPADDHYNRTCLEAIAGNVEGALEHLRRALEKILGSRAWARRDPDLEGLREGPEFRRLVGQADP